MDASVLFLVKRVPQCVKCVLDLNCGLGVRGATLKQRSGGMRAYGIAGNPQQAAGAATVLDGVALWPLDGELLPFDQPSFDCILLDALDPDFEAKLALCERVLAPLGRVMVSAQSGGPGNAAPLEKPEHMQAVAEKLGLGLFQWWPLDPAPNSGAGPGMLYMLSLPTYSVPRHARTLTDAGHPDWAMELLNQADQRLMDDAKTIPRICTEYLRCLHGMSMQLSPGQRLGILFQAQGCLYETSGLRPHYQEPYLLQARFWADVGRPDFALRLARTIHHAAPNDDTAETVERYRHATAPTAPPPLPPEVTLPDRPPRVLFITPALHDFGLDTLYDGLCRVLGPESVVDFPFKASLHGQCGDEETGDYPCAFDWPGEPRSLEQILAEVKQGRFDWVVFGDTEQRVDRALVAPTLAATADLPFFLIDQRDTFAPEQPELLAYTGRSQALVYFKREMVAGCDYGPNAVPLPLAYPDSRIPCMENQPRTRDIFWAGANAFGLRRLHVERLQALLETDLTQRIPQEEYSRRLLESRIGLNLFGYGFDTVRYWELPAHGCMLLSVRPPIHIPYNFIDGESAVFFDDLKDLENKVDQYRAHPEQCASIAAAGHKVLKRHHTGSARARQMLDYAFETAHNTTLQA